mgnify:CR=1 FL=1
MKSNITKKMFNGALFVLITSQLSSALIVIIDGLLTSRYLGAEMMGAQGIGSVYFTMISFVACLLSIGCQILTVQYLSKCSKDSARNIVTTSCIVGFILSILITLIIWIFPNGVAVLFGAPNGSLIQQYVADYLKGVSLGACGYVLYIILSRIVQLDGGGKLCTLTSIILVIVDIICDIVFGILLKMNLFGMGLASAISHILASLIMLIYMFSKRCNIKFNFKKLNFKYLGKVFINGIPRAVSMISRSIGPIILNVIILNILVNGASSTIGMSVLSIQNSNSYMVTSIAYSLGGSILLIGTFYFNERNYTEFKETINIVLKKLLFFVLPFTLLLVLASPLIVRIYISDWQTNDYFYKLSITSLRCYFSSLPFLAFNICFSNFMQTISKKVITNILNFISECLCQVLACFVLSRFLGYLGFFLGFLVGQAVLTLILGTIILINHLSTSNKYQKFFLPKDFIKENNVTIEQTIHTIEESIKLSETIRTLKNVKLDSKKLYKLALCIEEICVNIITHGFNKDNKKHSIILKVIIDENSIILTITDDCKMFDITKKLETMEVDPKHPEKNVGIRMIMALSKGIHYSNIMNMNNLQIII